MQEAWIGLRYVFRVEGILLFCIIEWKQPKIIFVVNGFIAIFSVSYIVYAYLYALYKNEVTI